MPLTETTATTLNSPTKKPVKKGFLGRLGSGRRASKASGFPVVPPASSDKESIIRAYTAAFFDGDLAQFFTDGATFSPPGVTLPIGAVGDMMKAMKAVFPDWESSVFKVEEQTDGTCLAYTQQRIGKMKADLPAIGPFPAVKLADASARIKAVPTILPVEIGVVTFEGTKVVSVDYSAAKIGETLDATTMDLASPVGFPCLFELMGVELPAPPPEAPTPCFYTVVHTFVEGAAEGWWAAISAMGEKEWAAMADKHHSLGFHNHSFLPTSPTGVINCLWECKAETTPEEFQAFIDGPDGPGPGVFVNASYKVMPGAMLPSSHFHAPAPAPTMPSTGTFFWVYHQFKEGAAPAFWEMMASLQPADWAAIAEKNHGLGFHGHSFAPCAVEGPCICIWESKEPMSADDFAKFIDGPDGPGAGAVFDNTVHMAMPGAVLPPAHFAQPSAVQHRINRIPIVAGSMARIVEVAKTAAFQDDLAGFAGLIGVDVLAVDDTTMMTHSRWQSEAYAKAAAAALGAVLGGALKAFVTGPPSPACGVAAWAFAGAASRGASSEPPAVRLTTLAIKEGALDEVISMVRAREAEFEGIDGIVRVDAVRTGASALLVAAEYTSMGALDAAKAKVGEVLKAVAPHLAAPPDVCAGTIAWTCDAAAAQAQALCRRNIARVKELVGEFMAGRPEGYMAGVADDITGSVLGGLIPGAERIRNKAEFGGLMAKMEQFMEVKKFEPTNWRAVGDDVLFNVEWEFLWKKTGEAVQTTALVRKVVRDGLICEKYHMISPELIARLTGNAPPHGSAAVERVQALLAEYGAGNPEGYMAGVADDITGSVLGGLIPGAERIRNKAEFGGLMAKMEQFMEVKKFEPTNWRAVGDDVLFNVEWEFLWKKTGEAVQTTALVRKVVRDGLICEKYHMISPELIARLTGNAPPHGSAAVERVQALLAEYGAGNPEGYMAGVADGITGSVLGGLIPGAEQIRNKAEFGGLMAKMEQFMEVKKFEPRNFCEMPNGEMIFNVDWSFVWKPTGLTVDTTAIVRKVVCDGMITVKQHMMDATCIEPPPAVSDKCVVCTPDDTATPDKCFGPPGAQAMMWVTKMADGRQAARIKVEAGFDWRATVKPLLPGCPDWCPATHFGYLESGTMGVRFSDGTEKTIRAGETYLIPPGHLPIVEHEPAVMVEFSQDTTYTQLKK